MRTLTEFNRTRVGLMGTLVTLLVVGVGQSFTSVPMLFATPTYYAQFADTGGISTGDRVAIAGVNVGLVRSLVIRGDRVLVGFSMPGKTIGAQSRAAIRTDTFLGRKNMAIQPRGSDPLRPNGIIPSAQTTTPYQIYDAFVDVTKAATDWNIDVVKRSLNVLSETFDQTAPHLRAALDGVAKFSGTIGNRDDQIKKLLANADKVTRVLGDRSQQVDGLLVNANTLLAAPAAQPGAEHSAEQRVGGVGTGVRLHQGKPQRAPRVAATGYGQRRTGQAQEGALRCAGTGQQIHRLTNRSRGFRAIFQGDRGQSRSLPSPSAVGRRGVQEEGHRPGELLAQRRAACVPLARPQRCPVAQRCPAAGAAGARGHPGSSATGRTAGVAVFVRTACRQPATARKPEIGRASCRGRV